MPLTTTLAITLNTLHTASNVFPSTTIQDAIALAQTLASLTDGTGLNQANKIYYEENSVAPTAGQVTYNFWNNTTLKDAFGNAVNFTTKISLLYIFNKGTNASDT